MLEILFLNVELRTLLLIKVFVAGNFSAAI